MSMTPKPKVPPHANAEAHQALMAQLKGMTASQVAATATKAGIYDERGRLTPEFGGLPSGSQHPTK